MGLARIRIIDMGRVFAPMKRTIESENIIMKRTIESENIIWKGYELNVEERMICLDFLKGFAF